MIRGLMAVPRDVDTCAMVGRRGRGYVVDVQAIMQSQPSEISGLPLDPIVAAELRAMVASGALELPRPLAGDTAGRWEVLAGWGRRDLALARLAEGHTDAAAILAEAGRACVPGALYGVWAARPGGVGARLIGSDDGMLLEGTVRFCSGARILDRALVAADVAADVAAGIGAGPTGGGRLLVDVALDQPGIVADPSSWASAAMASADTLDVRFDGVPIPRTAVVGGLDWYVERPGFAVGGAGVAAVWWGGAAGVLDRVIGHLPSSPDGHQLAHLGELHAQVEATHALLQRAAVDVRRRTALRSFGSGGRVAMRGRAPGSPGS